MGAHRYHEIGLLAVGGMAKVMLAKRDDDLTVVVKRIRPPYDKDPDFKALFEDEGRVAELLDHPRIVSLLERGEDEEGPYLVFEHVDGTDLGVVLEKRREQNEEGLELSAFFALAIPLCDALHAAHCAQDEAGESLALVHRDVSPGNLLISNEGEVKLADFGVAHTTLKTQHTVAGEMKGKFAYMAPEQTRGQCAGPSTDLFSTGVLLAECLTGRTLFDADTDADIVQSVREEAKNIECKNAPDELCALINTLLEKSPESRPQSAKEVSQQLKDIAMSLGLERGLRRHAAGLAALYPREKPSAQKIERRRTQRVLGAEPAPNASSPSWRYAAMAALALALLVGVFLFNAKKSNTDVKTPKALLNTPALESPPLAKPFEVAPKKPAGQTLNEGSLKNAAKDVVENNNKTPKKIVLKNPSVTKLSTRNARQPRLLKKSAAKLQNKNKSATNNKTPKKSDLLAQVVKPSPEKASGFGTLILQSDPWAEVTIDGAALNKNTPYLKLQLRAGTHRITLKNPHFNLQKTVSVTIPANGRIKRFIDLNKN